MTHSKKRRGSKQKIPERKFIIWIFMHLKKYLKRQVLHDNGKGTKNSMWIFTIHKLLILYVPKFYFSQSFYYNTGEAFKISSEGKQKIEFSLCKKYSKNKV